MIERTEATIRPALDADLIPQPGRAKILDDDMGRTARPEAQAIEVGALADIIDARRDCQGLEARSFANAPRRLRDRMRG